MLNDASGKYKQNCWIFNTKMAVKVTRVALYQKINVTRSTIYVENFILVSETAQGWYYAAVLSRIMNYENFALFLKTDAGGDNNLWINLAWPYNILTLILMYRASQLFFYCFLIKNFMM